MPLPDTHCHLAHRKLRGDLGAVVERATAAGVNPLINVGIDLASSEEVLRQAERWPWCHPVVGIHPHHASECDDQAMSRLAELADRPACRGVGESGLDFHYNFSPAPRQEEAFRAHCALALAKGLPLVVHSREAYPLTLAVLRDHPGLRGVIHCFSEGEEEAAALVEEGFYISFAGQVTWRGQERLAAAARTVPAERLLVETDAPFLAPGPERGKRCEPAMVVHTLARVAELRGCEPTALARQVTANAARLFGYVPPAAGD